MIDSAERGLARIMKIKKMRAELEVMDFLTMWLIA
jgi:hypothetical protein